MGKATTNSLDKVFKSKDISLPMKTLIFTFFSSMGTYSWGMFSWGKQDSRQIVRGAVEGFY